MLRMSLTHDEVEELATFNGLGEAGWSHTPAYRWKMAILQWRYRTIHREIALDLGLIPFERRVWGGPPDGDYLQEINRYIEPRVVL